MSASSREMPDNGKRYLDIKTAPLRRNYRLHARQVVNDAYRALELLETQKNLMDARIHYFALVALLRAVGHVLDKVDGKKDELVNAVSQRRNVSIYLRPFFGRNSMPRWARAD
jgi:hypothetical protein